MAAPADPAPATPMREMARTPPSRVTRPKKTRPMCSEGVLPISQSRSPIPGIEDTSLDAEERRRVREHQEEGQEREDQHEQAQERVRDVHGQGGPAGPAPHTGRSARRAVG